MNASFSAILTLMRLHKPVGILLLLWPTWHTAWLIHGKYPSAMMLALLTAGVIIMRSTGCVINDLCDRKFDGHVQRTANRPLVTGAVSVQTACVFALIGLFLAALIALQLPKICWILAVLGAFLTLIYPLSKRWFACPQLFLGLAFGAWPVLMTTAAFSHSLAQLSWPLLCAATLWPIAYDTLYAMEDKPDDLTLPIQSSAQWLGSFDLTGVLTCYAAWASCWLYLAWQEHSLILMLGVLVSLICLTPHLRAVYAQQKGACLKAFLHHQWTGGILWLALVAHASFSV